ARAQGEERAREPQALGAVAALAQLRSASPLERTMNSIEMKTPVGKLTLVEKDGALAGCYLETSAPPEAERRSSPLLERAKQQLDEYFAGKRDDFDLPLGLEGTDFRRAVWK